jgi:Ca2+-binding RTX toxin-like protein
VLKAFFRTDRVHFVLPSEAAGLASRTFTSFSQAAAESGVSRIYAGIHFSFDNVAGLDAGERIGQFAVRNFLKKDAGTATARLVSGELYVNGTSRSDNIRIVNRSGGLAVTSDGRLLGRFTPSSVTHITVDAGAGNDIVTLVNVNVSSDLYGGRGDDRLIGGNAADRIWGEDGWDTLFGGGGNDMLDGGSGRNTLFGGTGSDTLRGFRHLDHLFGGRDPDELLWNELA